jgi:hypothetical protein
MSHQGVEARAAIVRGEWDREERQQRALAGQRRCRELMSRLGLIPAINCHKLRLQAAALR